MPAIRGWNQPLILRGHGVPIHFRRAGRGPWSPAQRAGGIRCCRVDRRWLVWAGGLPWPGERMLDADGERGKDRLIVRSLSTGCVAALAAFYTVAGPGAVAAGVERYAIWMIAPLAILAAIGLCAWLDRPRIAGKGACVAALAVGWLTLLTFQARYFRYMEQTGGNAHFTFCTAPIEPKQAAMDYIRRRARRPGRPHRDERMVLYWPVIPRTSERYRGDTAAASVEQRGDRRRAQWQVEFSHLALFETCYDPPEAIIRDAAGEPLISVFGPGRGGTPPAPAFPAEDRPKSQFQKN